MKIIGTSIRPFIGSKNYKISRNFYLDLGFKEIITSEKMSYFSLGNFGFYLQDAYVKDWIDNSMIFLEVENLENSLNEIQNLKLTEKYENVRFSEYTDAPKLIKGMDDYFPKYNNRRHSSLNKKRPQDVYRNGLIGISNLPQN